MLNADKVSQKECFNPYYAPRTREARDFRSLSFEVTRVCICNPLVLMYENLISHFRVSRILLSFLALRPADHSDHSSETFHYRVEVLLPCLADVRSLSFINCSSCCTTDLRYLQEFVPQLLPTLPFHPTRLIATDVWRD